MHVFATGSCLYLAGRLATVSSAALLQSYLSSQRHMRSKATGSSAYLEGRFCKQQLLCVLQLCHGLVCDGNSCRAKHALCAARQQALCGYLATCICAGNHIFVLMRFYPACSGPQFLLPFCFLLPSQFPLHFTMEL